MVQPVYMDYHATTPVDPRVLERMIPYFTEKPGNAASRSHSFGWEAEAAVESAREAVARLVGASSREVVFTSGATEADNLAIFGVAAAYASKGRHIITQATEHKAVLDPCRVLERNGTEVTYLPVDGAGWVDPEDVRAAIRSETVLVSVMLANNEVGTIQPVSEIGRICREHQVLFHCDAVQGVGKLEFDVETANVDLLALSAHKMCGPKGVGALYVRRRNPRVRLEPLIHGGGHERGLRSGTVNVPAVVGFGEAARIAAREWQQEAERVRRLRERLHEGIRGALRGVSLNGHPEARLPGCLNLSFEGVQAEALMMGMRDVAVSSGSACTSANLEPSHVLAAMGVGQSRAHGAIRFGLGRFNDEEQVEHVVRRVVEAVRRQRELSS